MSDDVFDEIERLEEEGDLAAVERVAATALRGAEPAIARELWWTIARARIDTGRYRAAVDAARAAESPLLEGEALFLDWRFDEAADALADGAAVEEDEAAAHWFRGLVEEFRGADASASFARAARLDPARFPAPATLTDRDVDDVVRRAMADVPREIAAIVAAAVIEVRDVPAPHPDLDPLILGVYSGVDRLAGGVEDSGTLPARIELYRRNIARIARDREEAADELRITLLHEIGHHLGYDEEGLERLGLA